MSAADMQLNQIYKHKKRSLIRIETLEIVGKQIICIRRVKRIYLINRNKFLEKGNYPGHLIFNVLKNRIF